MKTIKSEVLKNAFFIVLKDKKEYEISHDLGLYESCPFCRDYRAQAYLFRNDRSNKYTVTYKTFLCKSIEMDTIKDGNLNKSSTKHVFFSKKLRQNKIDQILKSQILGV